MKSIYRARLKKAFITRKPYYDDPAGDPPVGDPPAGEGKITFTDDQQKHINELLAKERRTHQEQNKKIIEDLKKARDSQGATQAERDAYESRIKELEATVMSKEDIAKRDKNKLEKEYTGKIDNLTGERDTWRSRYENSTIEREILDEAVAADAFRARQLIPHLRPNTKMVEVVDKDGNGTGVFNTRVRLETSDEKGNPVTLDMSIKEAITKMKDDPEYANMFNSGVRSGVGLNGSHGGNGKGIDPTKMSTKDYLEARKKDPLLVTRIPQHR